MFGKLFRKTGAGANFPPEKLVIPYDDHHGEWVGRTADGDMFFITTPFCHPGEPGGSREFVARYLFDSSGALKDAAIDELGPRSSGVGERREAIISQRLKELGDIRYCDITVRPFSLERFDTEFGLIPQPAEEDGGVDYVILMPGDDMAFMAPWDGDYDT